MKWFFGFNEETDWFDNYFRYIKCAVNSARVHTDLDPHFLYDGKPGELTKWLEGKGVTVHYKRSRFYDMFKRLQPQGIDPKVASGTYLRAEIPDMVHGTDSFVLYTDCDVMFLGSTSDLENIKPKHFAAAPELQKDDWSYFNAGVMLMNTPAMHAKTPQFERLVRGSSVAKLLKNLDQESYNDMYKGRWTRLPIEYNWKPYWGMNENAKIVHFHGIKVENIERVHKGEPVQPILQQIYNKAPEAYAQFYKIAIEFEEM